MGAERVRVPARCPVPVAAHGLSAPNPPGESVLMVHRASRALVITFLVLATSAAAGPPDPVLSTVAAPGGGYAYLVPDGSGTPLASTGAQLLVRVRDALNVPCVGLVAADFEVDGMPLASMSDAFFPGTGAHNVTSVTPGLPGDYLIDTPLVAGGCGMGMVVRVQGVLVNSGVPSPIPFISPDVAPTGAPDGNVDLLDLGRFAAAFGGPYDPCFDFVYDGVLNIADLGKFATAYGITFASGATLDVD